MAMHGPQIGGASLFFHLVVNLTFGLVNLYRKIVTTVRQRIFHPSPQAAKLQTG
jgi:hypothetical protein